MTAERKTKVTIMIPTYNQQDYIGKAIESALGQDYPNLDVIVGDDCSIDDTENIVLKFNDKRLKYIKNSRNLGRTKNYRNLLFNHADGDFIVNLDGDDYYTDSCFISKAVDLIENNNDTVMVVARALIKTESQLLSSPHPGMQVIKGIDILKSLPNRDYFFMHMSVLYKRKLALELDFYRTDVISSDWESLYRMCLRGSVQYIDKEVGVWRIHGTNATSTVNYMTHFENLSIWGSIYHDSLNFGLNKFRANYLSAKCVAYFAQQKFPAISQIGNINLTKYIALISRSYLFATLLIVSNPKYFAKLIISFLGYYRDRKSV